MTYSPNVPTLSVSGELQIDDISKVFLAEFAGGVPVREVLMDPISALPPEAPLVDMQFAEADGVIKCGVECEVETPADLLMHESFATTPVASASGLRLHRVIGPDRQVVAQFDANRDMCPLDFLVELGGAVVAVAQPGDTYSWKLLQLGAPSEDGNVAPILAMREATAAEAASLDETYPGWLDACKKFDDQAAAEAEAAAGRPVMPPPVALQ